MRRRVFDDPGHAHFLTFSCAARRQLLNQDRCKRIVIHHLEAVRAEYDGLCFGFVIIPEHVHDPVDVSDKSSRHTPCAVRDTVIRRGIR